MKKTHLNTFVARFPTFTIPYWFPQGSSNPFSPCFHQCCSCFTTSLIAIPHRISISTTLPRCRGDPRCYWRFSCPSEPWSWAICCWTSATATRRTSRCGPLRRWGHGHPWLADGWSEIQLGQVAPPLAVPAKNGGCTHQPAGGTASQLDFSHDG